MMNTYPYIKNIEHENAGVLCFGVHRHFFT